MPQPVIILGESTRAAAESARRAGFEPWCVDLRGDRDLREKAPVRTVPRGQFPMGMMKLLDEAHPTASVLLCGPLENHLEFVRAVGFQRPIFGCGADAVAAVREPAMLPSLKATKGLKFPEVRTHVGLTRRLIRFVLGSWGRTKYLDKPRASFGGVGIRWREPGGQIATDRYVQQYIRGEPYTAVFHADGWSATLLGVVEQIVGEPAFGAGGSAAPFRVCGYVGSAKFTENARAALSHLGVQLTQRFDMRGPFSVDFIMDFKGTLWPVEVNPRYSPAAEVLERAEGVNAVSGLVPGGKGTKGWAPLLWGRASVIARQDGSAPDVYAFLPRDVVADVPEVGRAVARDEVVCTVMASGRKRDEVVEKLKAAAGKVYQAMEGAGVAKPQA